MVAAIARYTGALTAVLAGPSAAGGSPASSASSPASSSTGTPRRSAFASLEPGESPATT